MNKITLSLNILPRVYSNNDTYVDFYALTIKQEGLPDGGCHLTFPIASTDEPSDVIKRLATAVHELERHVVEITKK